MNVKSETVFKKRMKQRRLATGRATKPILREGLLRSKSRTEFSLQTSSISGKAKGKEILRGSSIPGNPED